MLNSFGGANPSVIPQPGDEPVCEGVQGYSCMTYTLPKGLHLEAMNMQNINTSFPSSPYKEYTAFGSHIHHGDLFYTSKALVKILRHQIGQKRGNPIPCNGGGWVDIGTTSCAARTRSRRIGTRRATRYKPSPSASDLRIEEHGNRSCRIR